MSIPCNIQLADILAQLQAPSCEERAAAVTAERLTAWAREMTAHGYRHSEESLEALRLYLAGYGLFLFGVVGAGKTYFFRAVGDVLRAQGRCRPAIYRMMDTVGRKVDEVREYFNEMSGMEIVLDDIGAEPTFNEYGNRWDILPWLLEMRLAASGRTHFTTNLSKAELEKRYGARTVDRLHEMAASVTFTGKSNRRTVPNMGVVRAYEKAAKEAAKKAAARGPQLPK